MRVKIGTSIDRDLLKKAQRAAAREGKRLNEVLEIALDPYLSTLEPRNTTDLVARTWGTSKLDAATLRQVLYEDVYDA